jgi:subtilisin-like proprotein convertase family protein
MKHLFFLLAAASGLAIPAAQAASVYEVFNYTNGTVIPDGNPSGLADARIVTSGITEIEDISVTIDISGSFNGDLYAALVHSTGFAILLNRVGRTISNSFGYDDDGLAVTFNDLGGFSEIHGQTSGGGLLSGTFGSDGRAVDPNSVLSTDSRSAVLSSIVGLDANGTWTLFVADLAGGDSHTLDSWSIEIIGVPEPASATLLVLGAALFLRRKR